MAYKPTHIHVHTHNTHECYYACRTKEEKGEEVEEDEDDQKGKISKDRDANIFISYTIAAMMYASTYYLVYVLGLLMHMSTSND